MVKTFRSWNWKNWRMTFPRKWRFLNERYNRKLPIFLVNTFLEIKDFGFSSRKLCSLKSYLLIDPKSQKPQSCSSLFSGFLYKILRDNTSCGPGTRLAQFGDFGPRGTPVCGRTYKVLVLSLCHTNCSKGDIIYMSIAASDPFSCWNCHGWQYSVLVRPYLGQHVAIPGRNRKSFFSLRRYRRSFLVADCRVLFAKIGQFWFINSHQ